MSTINLAMLIKNLMNPITRAMKTIIPLSLLLCSIASLAKADFRVASVGGVDFIIPPKSKLELKQDQSFREKYRYHFVRFAKLEGDYIRSLIAIQNATYYFSRSENGKEADGFTEKACDQCARPCDFCAIKDEGNDFVLRIDYAGMFQQGRFVADFNKLGLDLLKYFSQAEDRVNDANMAGPRKTKWAGTISQDIVEKIFELIPVPQESSLARFGFFSNSRKVVLLLSPKFTLQVDTSMRTPTGRDSFRYEPVSQIYVHLFRRQFAGSTSVFLEQRPFLQMTKGDYPHNFYIENQLVLLSGSSDMQLSRSINVSKFAAFYEGRLKRNNNGMPAPADAAAVSSSTSDAACVENSPDCISRNNSYLLFEDHVESFYEDQGCEMPPCTPVRAVFGERNPITPLLSVSINGEPVSLPVNSRVFDLVQSGKLTGRLSMYRLYRNRYAKFKSISPQTLLLPSDRFFSR